MSLHPSSVQGGRLTKSSALSMTLPFLSQSSKPRQSDAGAHTPNHHIPQDSQMKALHIFKLFGALIRCHFNDMQRGVGTYEESER